MMMEWNGMDGGWMYGGGWCARVGRGVQFIFIGEGIKRNRMMVERNMME